MRHVREQIVLPKSAELSKSGLLRRSVDGTLGNLTCPESCESTGVDSRKECIQAMKRLVFEGHYL